MAELVWKDKSSLAAYQLATSEYERVYRGAEEPEQYSLVTRSYHAPGSTGGEAISARETNWYNRLIWGDKSAVLPALLAEFAGSVQLIYIDPPFMTGRTFHSGTEIAYSDTWNNDLDRYLQWLYETLALLYQLLSPTGSLYVHLDWRVCHYAKIILDELFGFNLQAEGPGLRNEIIWHYQSGGRFQKYYARKHDTILLYTKSSTYCFHGERVGERRGGQKRNHMRKEIGPDGRSVWTIRSAGRVYAYPEDSLMARSDVWHDISHLHQRDPERTGYATQKPAALLERVILASSEEHDLVLDCFCGSGVTPVVAERYRRRWIACDRSEAAIAITSRRLLAQGHYCPFAIQNLVVSPKQAGPQAPEE